MSRRRLAKLVTSIRLLDPLKPMKSWNISYFNGEKVFHGACELDSHADTCVAGPNCIVLEYTNQSVNVAGFSHDYESIQDVPIVTATTAIDNPKTGVTSNLIIDQALYLPDKVSCTLFCPIWFALMVWLSTMYLFTLHLIIIHHLSWSPGCNPVMGDKRAKQWLFYLLFFKDKSTG